MARTLHVDLWPRLSLADRGAALVLTPNDRAADHLGVPGRTLDDQAAEALRPSGLAVASPLVAHRALKSAVREVLEVADPEGTARAIAPTLRELLRAGADPSGLSPFAPLRAGPLGRSLAALARLDSLRAARLARVGRAYQQKLRDQRLVDEAERLVEAAPRVRERCPIVVYGYPRLGPGELSFVDAVAADGSRVYLPCSGHPLFAENRRATDWLAARGWRVEGEERPPESVGERLAVAFLGPSPAPAEVQAQSYAHLEAEVRGALARVKALLTDGVSPADVVLVLRDEALYGPVMLDVAWEYGLPVRAQYRIALSDTRVGAWLRLALDAALEGFPFEATARLLSHPIGGGLTRDAWQRARETHPAGLEPWTALGAPLSGLVWPERAARSDFDARLRAPLDAFHVRQRAQEWPREMLAFGALLDGLRSLAQPAGEMLTREDFVDELIEALALATVQAHPGRGGVELHTPLSIYGAQYRYVLVLGVAEGHLPAPVQDDRVLDYHERARLASAGLRLESAAEAARREELSFWAMLATATDALTLSYPRLVGDQATLPSPYFRRLGLHPEDAAPRLAASLEEARRYLLRDPDTSATPPGQHRDAQESFAQHDPVLVAARHAWTVELRRESAEPHDEYDGLAAEPLDPASRVFSATQILALGQCPFKWFAGHPLRLAEPEEVEDDLLPSLRGTLYHKTLEIALAWGRASDDPRAVVLARLEEAFREAEVQLGLPRFPAWSARRDEHLRTLRRCVVGDDFMREGARIVALEQEFRGAWRGLRVAGRVDRIDRTDAGLVLMDYKTSSSPPHGAKDDSGRARVDVQLPLYREAAAPALFPGEPVADALYYSLTKGKKLGVGDADPTALQALAERVKVHLQSGCYPVDPDLDGNACVYCEFDPVCRRGPRLARKRGTL